MSSISIKGIFLGALISFGLSAVLGLGSIFIISKLTGAETSEQLRVVMETSWTPFLAIQVVGIIIPIFTGYCAAWIAKRGELINGALSSVFIVGSTLFALVEPPPPGGRLNGLIAIIAAPLLCLLGGFLRKKTSRIAQEIPSR